MVTKRSGWSTNACLQASLQKCIPFHPRCLGYDVGGMQEHAAHGVRRAGRAAAYALPDFDKTHRIGNSPESPRGRAVKSAWGMMSGRVAEVSVIRNWPAARLRILPRCCAALLRTVMPNLRNTSAAA